MPKPSQADLRKFLQEGAAKGAKKNQKGEYTQWNASSQDGKELKIYMETGCCDNLSPAQLRMKFPQFNKYFYSTFNSAFHNAKKALNKQLEDRGVGMCKTLILFSF